MASDPVLIAYGVKRTRDGKRNHWRRIGEAFPHEEGVGLTVLLDAVPLDGRIILLELDAKDHMRLIAEQARLKITAKRKPRLRRS